MPVISISKKNMFKLIGRTLSDEFLKEKIPMLGTALERITKDEIIVEIFPNRPDMLSEAGFSRALSSFLGIKKGLRNYKINDSGRHIIIEPSVNLVRPYTVCAIAKNLKLDDEKIKDIMQMQEKLHITFGRNRKKLAIGIYPIEEIKFPVYYKAMHPEKIKFTPLETAEEMTAVEILEKHPKGIEYASLLKDKKLFPVFIDSSNQILSMPPIINSEKTGKIRTATKQAFIECSGFDLRTLNLCLNILVASLADAGAEICSIKLKYPNRTIMSPSLAPGKMPIDIKYISKILGINLSMQKAKHLLEKMGYGFKSGKVLIPAYRQDILHQVDLAEDIAIAYGYENFKSAIPNISTIAEENDFEKFKNKIAELMAGFSLLETNSFSLMPLTDMQKMNTGKAPIIVENPSTEYNSLRDWITPSLLKILSENRHNEYPQDIYEIATVFQAQQEQANLAVALCNEKANFTEIMKIFSSLMSNLGVKYEIQNANHNSFISGRVAKIIASGKEIAVIGELHPAVIRNFEIDFPVSCFELNLTWLYKVIKNE